MADTFFASSERSGPEHLSEEREHILTNPIMDTLMKSVGGFLAVLNENRQILAVNRAFDHILSKGEISSEIGLRPGEALQCLHAQEGPGGCGTSRYCPSCGAALAIVSCLGLNETVERNCFIRTEGEDLARDLAFQVRAHPLSLNDNRYVLLFLQDISRQERHSELERIFFHDISNMLQGLISTSELIAATSENGKLSGLLAQSSRMLAKEVEIQRCLLKDDPFACRISRQEFTVRRLLGDLENLYSGHPLTRGRRLLLHSDDPDHPIRSDLALLLRILGNMVTNALESSDESDEVRLWTEKGSGHICFNVQNRMAMDENVARRIFQRGYTTKGESGRGWGTYSMKLLGETVLGGKVEFSSDREEGTLFRYILFDYTG